jgi:biotin synthase
LRKNNRNVKRYRFEPDEIISMAKNAAVIGYKTIVMQSGESDAYSMQELVYIISEIKKLGVSLTLSIGEKSAGEYETYKNAGANRFLLRIETTDAVLYKQLHPNMNHQNRFECLQTLKKLGYETGTGSLVGLPNQTLESIANDLLFFKELDADMIGVGPFIPHPDTPLKDAQKAEFNFALKVTCLVRLLLPDINIPATTAMETLKQGGRILALKSASNVVMPNITTGDFGMQYSLYPGKPTIKDEPLERLKDITCSIQAHGLDVATTNGDSVKFSKRKFVC